MFQEYCFAHGNPCMSGLLYCCEECKNEDYEFFVMDEEGHIEEKEAELIPNSLVYECFWCKAHHDPYIACNEEPNNYSWLISSNVKWDSPSYFGNTANREIEMNAMNEYETKEDPLVWNGNQSLQSNYKKWLVDNTASVSPLATSS
ncbi:uncharacterized protein PRCAT00002396001 [Priceomyces carsonii]|uniref:uncharacterized protein n=1 Tax=Priceomyces carsonii TaxID=28549 RepID=UPI002ED84007|nr:unnamed protein product [Priceomyces carsonii]